MQSVPLFSVEGYLFLIGFGCLQVDIDFDPVVIVVGGECDTSISKLAIQFYKVFF